MNQQNRGWLVTWCAVGINLACGILYSWSVFAAALVRELGFTKMQAATPYTIALATLALLSIPGGKLQDRFGPRLCATLCGVLVGSGMILAGFANSLLALGISFGLMVGSGTGLAYGATTPAAVKWFPVEKRGQIIGLIAAGVGLASVYIAPMTQYLVGKFGIQTSFIIEGILLSTVILILAQFLSSPPAEYIPLSAKIQVKRTVSSSGRDFSPSEMLKTPQFRLIWLMYLCGSMAGLMIIGHLVIIAKVQANIDWAYIFVAILAIFNASGRMIGGLVSDRLGRSKTIMAALSLQAINMLFFNQYSTGKLLIIGIAVAGACYGSLLAVFPALTFDYFGMKNGGVNNGLIFSAWGVAGIIGPLMAGYIADVTQSYHAAYMVAAGLLALAAFLGSFLKPPTVELS